MTSPTTTDLRPDAVTTWRPSFPVDVRTTLGPLRRGTGDPTYQFDVDGALWRTTRMPGGAAAYRLTQRGAHRIECQAWGPGADEVVADLPDLLGARDEPAGFEPNHPLLHEARRRNPGLRIPRTGRVLEALIPAVLEQKVTGKQARAAWRWLLRKYGEAAPGPAPSRMLVPPPADVWRRIPSWDWHRAGVDPKRARAALACATVANRLEECVALPIDEAERRLRVVPGVGVWTAAEVTARALGHSDSLSVGDYHLSNLVGWALLGHDLDDAGMLDYLEPWRPHRYRVVRLLELTPGAGKPRRGPRMSIQDHRFH